MKHSAHNRFARAITLWLLVSFVGGGIPLPVAVVAQPPPGMEQKPTVAETQADGERLISLNFRDAPLDTVLSFYSEITGRTLIKSPGINATITLRGQTRLTEPEALEAIESVLAMNNVVLVPMGEKFLKVVQPAMARQEGMPLAREMPQQPFSENDQLISQVVTLKYIEIAEVQGIIQGFLHGYGKIQPLERTNGLLITDTALNLQRIMEILEYIDQPTEAKVETRIYELKYAEAAKIASRLNELIQEAQAAQDKPRVAAPAAATAPVTPPGIIRARQPGAPPPVTAPPSEADVIEKALAERGIVQGKVKIVADERTNILIVISRPSNFAFFDKIVQILDRPVEPEVIVRVKALEYAKAEEIASILNEFIGAAKSETKVPSAPAAEGGEPAATEAEARSQALREFVQQRAQERLRAAAAEEKSKIGQLSANTKILADKRTNSLLLMGTRGDLAALEDVIERLDTMLAQVLIEAVIVEVALSKSLDYGVDWLQRSMVAYNEDRRGPLGNQGVAVRESLFAFGGGQRLSDGTTFRDASTVERNDPVLGAGALTYYTTLFDLNIDAVIRMTAGSSDARILSTPVILTTDNTEAKIVVGEERPVVTSTSTSTAGQQTSAYEYRNIGINLTVTPRINPQRFVVMEISQTADNVGGFEVIDGNNVPVITKREFQAQIAVPHRSTVVLGGLVATDKRKTRAKVPILGDIPVIGTLFRADTRSDNRTELMVLLTPYVLTTPEEARIETARLHGSTRLGEGRWYRGWSDSELAKPTSAMIRQQRIEERERRAEEKAAKRKKPVRTTPRVTVVVPSEMDLNADTGTFDTGEEKREEPVETPPAAAEDARPTVLIIPDDSPGEAAETPFAGAGPEPASVAPDENPADSAGSIALPPSAIEPLPDNEIEEILPR